MEHSQAAEIFLQDKERAKWHNQAIWFVRFKRDRISELVPDWEKLRETARAIKAHTLSKLPDYLIEFEKNALSRGIHIHWANSAEEHNEIILSLMQQRNINCLVKSKSMLTEECHLNPFLIKNGIEVIDTDLGERIVQLADEPPSHIILPAIHKKKEEVGQLFHEKLGTPKGESDPKRLTDLARGHLREKIFKAGAGLTGVNFAIAETGGFVVCTNEGNADIGTSLPPLQIASMGIEKIIPRLIDLGVFTRLLARSATGQPITTYTTHFHGPKKNGELHIIIVDNGRSKILLEEVNQSILSCIRCGACMNTCPVYRRSGGYSYGYIIPGPLGSVLAPHRDQKKYASLPFASTLCGSCTDVCPVQINLHEKLLNWRGTLAEKGYISWSKRISMYFAGLVFKSPFLYTTGGLFMRKIIPLLPRFIIYGPYNVWGKQRELPPMPKKSFSQLVKERPNDK
jgi:L-lactate dehydrogenase complex protein LldF